MKPHLMKELPVHLAFILCAAALLLITNHMEWYKEYVAFGLIPLLIAYYVGRYIGRKHAKEE